MLTISPYISGLLTATTTSLNLFPMQEQEQTQSKRKATSGMEENPLLNAAKRTKKDAKNMSHKSKLLAKAEPMPGGLFIVRASSLSQPESSSRETSTPLQPSSSLPLKRNAPSDLRVPASKKVRAESQPPMTSGSTSKSKPTSTTTRPALTEHPRQQYRSGSVNGHLGSRSGFVSIPEEDAQIEDDVRAMEAEADHLRRTSRVYVSESSTPSTSIIFQLEREGDKDKPRARSKSRGKGLIATDTIQPVPLDETPQIERNKRLREGTMNAVIATNGDVTPAETSRRGRERERELNTVNGHHRRKSSISSRGKRISTSFEVTGVIPQPHNSVSDASFYKHIDADLPDPERLRTLLIWCASRAMSKPSTSSKQKPTTLNNGEDKDNPPDSDLPPLSAKAQEALKAVQEDMIRMLAERRIDLSLYGDDVSELPQAGSLKPNEQNVTNRVLEVRYAEQIKRAQEEEEAWKRMRYHYDAYVKRQKEMLEKRKARMTTKKQLPPSLPSQMGDEVSEDTHPTTPSDKAKGKQRDTSADDPWKGINEHNLPEDLQRAVKIARALIASVQAEKAPSPELPQSQTSPGLSSSSSQSRKRPKRGSDTPLPVHVPSSPTFLNGEQDLIGQQLDEELERRMKDVEYKLDSLLVSAHTVRSLVRVVEELLDRWFELLNQNLASRVNIRVGLDSGSPSGSGNKGKGEGGDGSASSSASALANPSSVGNILRKYVPRQLPPAGFVITGYENDPSSQAPLPPSSNQSRTPIPFTSGVDPRDVFRALSLVDRTRPPALVGDAARRAAREVQRVVQGDYYGSAGVGGAGEGVVGERRITGVVGSAGAGGVLHTPRKAPATPRRGGERTPRRERTPARDR
ncbi:hypothetical protein AX15_001706 [Amanita polypyramis BW_CC]|nr:hypothetical protein AX15_001706 [Amanita polypyramis BW_CC]